MLQKQAVMLVQVLSPDEVEPVYNGRLNLVDSETEDLSDGRNMKLKITRNMRRHTMRR